MDDKIQGATPRRHAKLCNRLSSHNHFLGTKLPRRGTILDTIFARSLSVWSRPECDIGETRSHLFSLASHKDRQRSTTATTGDSICDVTLDSDFANEILQRSKQLNTSSRSSTLLPSKPISATKKRTFAGRKCRKPSPSPTHPFPPKMGRLIKNHWARLIVLTASVCTYNPQCPTSSQSRRLKAYNQNPDQVGSAIEAFIWPKIFWDTWTKNLDGAVKPVPVLQILNLLMGLLGVAWEWPLKYFAGTMPHRSIEFRLLLYPLSSILAALIYQGTNAAIYYLVGIAVYFWAYSEGEVSWCLGL